MKKILIVDNFPQEAIQTLIEHGYHVAYRPEFAQVQIYKEADKYDVLVIRSKCVLDTNFFKDKVRLKLIVRAGAGLDLIDLKAAQDAQIKVLGAGEGNKDAVAEHTVALIINLLHRVWAAGLDVRAGIWDRSKHTGNELNGKAVGLIGFGNMGRAVAYLLQNFGCQLLVYDRDARLRNVPSYVRRVALTELQAEAEIVSLHIPLNAENRQLINLEYLSAFKKPIYLINTARGEVLDHSCLLPLLTQGRLRGLGLDVFENEVLLTHNETQKTLFDALRQENRVLMTPHIAGITQESYTKIGMVVAEKIRLFYDE